MDNIQPQVTSIRLDLEERIDRVVHLMKTELRSEFQPPLNEKVVSLEAYMEMQKNSIRQDTTSTLEQLKEMVAAVHESQEKMWRAIDGMSKEIQDLVQRDAGIEGEEETEPIPASEHPAKE